MAQFTRVHGDYQPVANFDQFEYTVGAVNAATSAATVQPQGPKLEYFTVSKGSGSWTTAQINQMVQTIQQLATIYIYEYTEGTPDTLAVAMYPVGAWGDVTDTGVGTLDQAITDATGAACSIADSATFTN